MPQPCHYRARTDLSSLLYSPPLLFLPLHLSVPLLSRGGAGVVHCPQSRPLNLVPDVALRRSPSHSLLSLSSKIHTAVGKLHVPRTLVLPYCEADRPITIFSRISAPFHKSHRRGTTASRTSLCADTNFAPMIDLRRILDLQSFFGPKLCPM